MHNTERVLEKIFEKPIHHFHVRELARETNLNPNTIINITRSLAKDNLIIIERKKHLVEIYADIENKKFISKKRVYNLEKIYNSEITDFLVSFYNPKAIVLIGSYSRGEDTEKSDIDIAIISSDKNIPDLDKFEKKLKRNIHIMPIIYKDISEEFYANIINGIVIYGYLSKK